MASSMINNNRGLFPCCDVSRIVGFLMLQLLLFSLISFESCKAALIEPDRQLEYRQRGYVWPLVDYVPNTTGWRALMEERFHQVQELTSSASRYEAWYQTINSALVAPNFTEHGFGLARAPMELVEELQRGIRGGLSKATEEPMDGVINGPQAPLLVHRRDLVDRVLHEMLPYAEEWSGIPLKAHQGYGFRLYRNESQLHMHVDRLQTHVISFILHIDSEKAQPWPIFIEDFQGRTHEVILTPGDILFYESSKCFHGRPRRLNGEWYR